jgi:hypothetical protein
MDFVYLLLHESSSEWEDMVIILTEEDAIKESINRPNHRVEIFSKTAQQDILLRIIIINMENLFKRHKKGRFVQGNRRFPGFLDSWKIEQNMIS